MTVETFICVVCGDSETNEGLLEYCWGCGNRFHLNPRQGPGKDCGLAWIEDEEEGIQTFCNTCMDAQRQTDQQQMQEIARAAAAGAATPEMMAQIAQMLGGTLAPSFPTPGSAAAGNPFATSLPPASQLQGMPQPTGSFPGVPALADAIVLAPLPTPTESDDEHSSVEQRAPADPSAPPARVRRQAGEPRRFRRIE